MTRIALGLMTVACLTTAGISAPARGQDEPTSRPARVKRIEPQLKPGMPAPKLSIGRWIKGEPVAELQAGKVYVVEFWATWCAPCRSAIPQLTRLQKQYADSGLVVLGVNVLENDAGQVEPFMQKVGGQMGYRVGVEEPLKPAQTQPNEPMLVARPGRMAVDWMEASGNQGLPCTFIVDREGKIAWVGHPSRLLTPLTKVMQGRFDLAEQAALDAKVEALHRQAFEAAEADAFDEALAAMDQLAAVDPEAAAAMKPDRLGALLGKGDLKAAAALARSLLDKAAVDRDPTLAFQTAQRLLPEAGQTKLDPEMAFNAAKLAYDLGDQSVQFKSLMASGYAVKGQWAQAIALQSEVVEKLSGPLRKREQQRLDLYKKKAGQE